MDGSVWQPIPPEGFVALGHVCQGNYDVHFYLLFCLFFMINIEELLLLITSNLVPMSLGLSRVSVL